MIFLVYRQRSKLWTEFTNSLLTAVMRSWQSHVTYFTSSDENAASGFLTDLDNLKIIAFLTDILTVFSRYQKQLQDDTLTIVDVDQSQNSQLEDNVVA